MTTRLMRAVRNNAAWCESMCRAHGIGSTWDDRLWVADTDSPPWYPDAVSLRSAVEADTVASVLAGRPEAAVKDGFADVDLSVHGFVELFEARWVTAESVVAGSGWETLRSPESLQAWASAWGGVEVFVPGLLEDPSVRVVGEFRRGKALRGAVLNRAAGVVGVSNVFDVDGVSADTWSGVARTAATWTDLPLVGYEAEPDLAAARAAGFVELGPLRVWARR